MSIQLANSAPVVPLAVGSVAEAAGRSFVEVALDLVDLGCRPAGSHLSGLVTADPGSPAAGTHPSDLVVAAVIAENFPSCLLVVVAALGSLVVA